MPDNPHPADELGASSPLVPPLYQSSVYSLPDLDALEGIMNQEQPGFIYARDAHPNARRLAARLSELEGGDWTVVCASGMAAVSGVILATVRHGERIVASNYLYGRTTQLLQTELRRFGIATAFVDTNDLEAVERALRTPSRLLFVETLSNPLLRVAPLERLSALAKQHDCLLVVDNTFATPELARPLDLGAELVIESLTKLMGGHSDVTLGSISGRGPLFGDLARIVSTWGLAANPFDCWLAQRGLETLRLRLRAAVANADALASWLVEQPGVVGVCYPGRRDHADHDLAARLFPRGCGNMLCFELAGGRDAVNRFLQAAPGVPLSPSLGHTGTTCSHPASTSHRHVSEAERLRQGITDGLVRLSVGIEELDEIKAKLAPGLATGEPPVAT